MSSASACFHCMRERLLSLLSRLEVESILATMVGEAEEEVDKEVVVGEVVEERASVCVFKAIAKKCGERSIPSTLVAVGND